MLLEIQSLKKIYTRGVQKVNALENVSFTVNQGEFVSIMGPSGSGKSTLLHLLGGLDRSSEGSVKIAGLSLESLSDDKLSAFRRQKLGFVFQFFNLLPTLTAEENVCLPLLLDGKPRAQVREQAIELLDLMGLGARLNHKPEELSGGEMQRVAIARALIAKPLLILADEPTGNLDSQSGKVILELLARMVHEKNYTILMVTHDPRAASFGNRKITMRDGRIESDS